MRVGGLAVVTVLVLALEAQPSFADSKWVQIGGGPSLTYAKAYCDNASMGVGRGVMAWGSPGYVAGAELGNAIGNAILQNRFFTNCMTMQGWQKVHIPGTPNGAKPMGREK